MVARMQSQGLGDGHKVGQKMFTPTPPPPSTPSKKALAQVALTSEQIIVSGMTMCFLWHPF